MYTPETPVLLYKSWVSVREFTLHRLVIMMTIFVAETKGQISNTATAQLICTLCFRIYAKSWFSYDMFDLIVQGKTESESNERSDTEES